MAPFSWSSKFNAFTKVCHRCATEYIGAGDQNTAERVLRRYFHRNRASPDELHSWCKKCGNEVLFKHRFGLSKEQARRKLAKQNSRCDICSKEISLERESHEGKATAHLDHDHSTDKVRSFLCMRCNVLMAALDDREWLSKALAYREHEDRNNGRDLKIELKGEEINA